MRVEHRIAAIAARMALLQYADTILSPDDEEEMVGFIERQFTDEVLLNMKKQERERRIHARQAKRTEG